MSATWPATLSRVRGSRVVRKENSTLSFWASAKRSWRVPSGASSTR
ncbi:MAG TPA: hypothetical protein VKG64_20045 [Methylomirabilota bacterium]|nr:hypothetical protein [Methylomirabilota bacterium]